jgi:hypothetical protein
MCYDPWDAYAAKLTSSTGILVLGLMGAGKSMCAKCLAMRLIAAGRRVIVQGDPKGEWTPLAGWISQDHPGQAQIIAPGIRTTTTLNPLDAGTVDRSLGETQWAAAVAGARSTRIRAIISILRGGQPFTMTEENALLIALERVAARTSQPTLRDVYDELEKPSDDMTFRCGGEAPRQLALTLRLLMAGPLAGVFDGQSTVKLNPSAALTVVDTSTLAFAEPRVRAIASECITGWVTSTLRSRDGQFRLLISEEGWEDVRDPYRVAGMDEVLRMSGHWSCSLMMILHELSDSEMFGEAGSAHRNRLRGLLSKCETQILYRCSAREKPVISELLRLSDMESEIITSSLPQGWGWWRIGSSLRLCVRPEVTPYAYEVFNTDRGRIG